MQMLRAPAARGEVVLLLDPYVTLLYVEAICVNFNDHRFMMFHDILIYMYRSHFQEFLQISCWLAKGSLLHISKQRKYVEKNII
jgi:hypothetical protein